MNKTELIDAVAEAADLTKADLNLCFRHMVAGV